METLVPFVLGAISKKHTFFRTKLEFALIVRACMRPTSTTKDFKKSVVRRFIEELFNRCFHIEYTSRHAIYEETSCKESITPIAKWNRRMSEKSKTSFHYMTVLAFTSPILLMSMRTCYTMYNTKLMKEGVEIAIFAPQSD
jgi:hypothetical protein